MANFFNLYLYQPVLQLLIFIYQNLAFNDLGLAIIILTVLVRVVFMPIFHKSFKNQLIIQRLQPTIAKIRHDHKHDQEKQAAALLSLYRQHGVNPFSGFLLLLVQLPILIALYQVFLNGLSEATFPNQLFLNLIDLENRSMVMVGLASLAQYWQGRQMTSSQTAEPMARYFNFFGLALTVAILVNLPAAVALYWLTSTLFSVAHHFYINKTLKNGDFAGENKKNA